MGGIPNPDTTPPYPSAINKQPGTPSTTTTSNTTLSSTVDHKFNQLQLEMTSQKEINARFDTRIGNLETSTKSIDSKIDVIQARLAPTPHSLLPIKYKKPPTKTSLIPEGPLLSLTEWDQLHNATYNGRNWNTFGATTISPINLLSEGNPYSSKETKIKHSNPIISQKHRTKNNYMHLLPVYPTCRDTDQSWCQK
jgi:hypothetical protein